MKHCHLNSCVYRLEKQRYYMTLKDILLILQDLEIDNIHIL